MKLFIILLAATVSSATLESRQAGCKLPSAPPPSMGRKNAVRKYFAVGPYTVPPGGKAGDGHSHGGSSGAAPPRAGGLLGGGGMGMEGEDSMTKRETVTGSKLCGTCTVLQAQLKMFYPDGSPANLTNGMYVHHILTNPSLGSASGQGHNFVGARGVAIPGGFVGAGDDNGNRPTVYAPKDNSQFESGFHISPTSSYTAEIVLVNYNQQSKSVCIAYELEYLPGHVGRKVKSVLISAAMGVSAKTSNTRAVNTTSSAMPVQEAGYLLSARGHLHNGGNAMYMKISGKNSNNCASRATYGGKVYGTNEATISDMSDCNPKPWRLEPGDSLTMTAEYDLTKHPLRETAGGGEGGTMGMFRLIFAPDRG